MTDTGWPNAGQAEHWDDVGSGHWVDAADRYDAMLRLLGELAIAAADVASGDRVLDIGCGSGATTLALARLVGPTGSVTGIDLSDRMLAPARAAAARAGQANVRFALGDAQVHPFPPASFDVAFSRFGLMFFADPAAAFANIAGALAPAGRLGFVCWRDLALQEWIEVLLRAAAPHVARPDFGKPGEPGMAGLADPDRTRALLEGAGFTAVETDAVDTQITFGGYGTVDDVMPFFEAGAFGRALLTDASPDQAGAVRAAVRDALTQYETPAGVVLGAAVWVVTAQV